MKTKSLGLDHRPPGFALAAVLMMTSLISVLAVGLALLIRIDTMQSGAEESTRRNFYAAEAGVNRGMGDARNVFLDFNVPSGGDFDLHTMTVGAKDVAYRLTEVPGNPLTVTLPPGDVFAGLNSIQYRYSVLSDTLDGQSRREARVGASFEVNNVPLFQFLTFYDIGLEITPAAEMTLHGRIHSNGDLYLNSGETLRIEDSNDMPFVQVSAVGDVYRGRNDAARQCYGTVIVDKLEDVANPRNDLDPLRMDCRGGSSARIPEADLAAWMGSITAGVDSVAVPEPDVLARGSGNLYWDRSDLRIVLNLNRTDRLAGCSGSEFAAIEVQNANGSVDATRTGRLKGFMLANPGKIFYTDVPTASCAATCRTDIASSNPGSCAACGSTRTNYTPAFAANDQVYRRADDANLDREWTDGSQECDYRRGGFVNNREGSWMVLLNVDLGRLLEWNRDQSAGNRLFNPNDSSDGGVVLFLSVAGPDSGGVNNYGVRIFDSPDLDFPAVGGGDPTGITVVSDQAAYVQGNFNTVRKNPAAVLSDSVNILSNAWEAYGTNDRKSGARLSERADPTDTTMNVAFLGGTDDPEIEYSGGVQNYPRFHEDWRNVTFRYRGSLVTLGRPLHVDGRWCGNGTACNIYDAPDRDWDFDADFNDVTLLPPLTPRLVWVQQTLFDQDFR
jgi:hypothetical protein